jgi:hypothetical protein
MGSTLGVEPRTISGGVRAGAMKPNRVLTS